MKTLLALFSLVSVLQDDTPLRSGCKETDEVLARLQEGQVVKLRAAVAGANLTCVAVTVELDGRKLPGYVAREDLDGLDPLEESRRHASATQSKQGTPRPVMAKPVTAKAWPAAKALPKTARPTVPLPPPAFAPRPAPEFSFASLDDPARAFTRQSLLGKTYVMQFWAAWCRPCAAQLPELRRLHEKYKDRPFTILTLAVDAQPGEAASLPWSRALLAGGFDSPAARQLAVDALPATLLVDSTGRIVGRDLAGAALERAIERLLAN